MPKPISNIETIGQREDRQVKEVVDNIVQKIDLSDLKKGVDSLEMRLWYPDHDMVENILTIRFVDTLLIATKTNIWQTYPDHPFKKKDTTNYLLNVIIDSIKSTNINMRLLKSELIDSLINTYILSFPQEEDFDSSSHTLTSEYRLIFEIAKKNKYQFFIYGCSARTGADKEAYNKIRSFLYFLKRNVDKDIHTCD